MSTQLRVPHLLRVAVVLSFLFSIGFSLKSTTAAPFYALVNQADEGSNEIIYDTPGSYAFTIPEGVTSLSVQAWGAGGGGAVQSAQGGGGGYAQSQISVNPSDIVEIYVGTGGGIATSTTCDARGAGGGEASHVQKDSIFLLMAGGGGGAGTVAVGLHDFGSNIGGNGGAGGGEVGLMGQNGISEFTVFAGQGGQGGTQTTGGEGGEGGFGDFEDESVDGMPGSSGGFGVGGSGGYIEDGCSSGGGDGGGGYYGGGGGGSGGQLSITLVGSGGGGGGGSSFGDVTIAGEDRIPGGPIITETNGYGGAPNSDGGHGYVRISWEEPVAPTPIDTNTPVPANTNTPAPTFTPQPTDTATPVPPTNTVAPTSTPIPPTSTVAQTPTVVPTATSIPSATDTLTQVPPTDTPIPTNTNTPAAMLTFTPQPTDTAMPVPPTNTVVPTSTPVPPTSTVAQIPTVMPTATSIPSATDTLTPVPPTNTAIPINTMMPPTVAPTATSEPVTATLVPTITLIPTVKSTPTIPLPVNGQENSEQAQIFIPFMAGDNDNFSPPIQPPTVTPIAPTKEPTPQSTVEPSDPAPTDVPPTKEPTTEPTDPPPTDIPTQALLKPIGDQQAPLGNTLRIDLASENVADVTFDVSPLPLPKNATLNAKTGEFLFNPSPEQIGSFTLTFTARKGQQEQSETVTITVPQLNANGATGLSGRILDANDAEDGITTPLLGATVRHIESGQSVTTDTDGYFEISGLDAGEHYFEFNGATANPAGTYGAYRSQQMLIANVVKDIERPIYIMAIDIAGQTMVNPNQETIVTNPNINTTIEIPANSVMDDSDNLYAGPISVSEVPDDFTPGSLPDTLDPGMVLTIQPMGLTFSTTAPITFPNFDNLAPRSVVDIWSMDHETSQFFVAGKGQVSSDGSIIETIEGGIQESSWHFPSPPQPEPGPSPDNSNDNQDPPDCSFSSRVSTADGCLSTSIDLPSYISLGQTRGLSFVYNSKRAYPQPIFSINADVAQNRGPIPNQLSYSLKDFGGIKATVEETYLDVEDIGTAGARFRAATTIDGSELETAVWPYIMRVNQYYESSISAAEFNERKIIVNGQDSPFGAGWDISGLQRIYPQQDGSLLLTNGDGSALVFDSFDIGLASLDAGRTINSSLVSGSDLIDARNAIEENFVDKTISQIGVSTISAKHLRHSDILFASVQRDDEFLGDNVITPLTDTEQDALLAFVKRGGCTILMVSDNLGDDDLPVVNQSFVAPFGMTVQGYTSPSGGLAITDPSASSVTSGPFGEVTMMEWGVGIIGGISELGPYATSLADSPIGSALAVIEPNAISPGSGGVVIFTNTFVFDNGGFFTQHQALFLNTLNFCLENMQPSPEIHYDGPDGDFTRIIKVADGSFTRYMKSGLEYRFNADGMQTAVVDRNGNTTTFTYDTDRRLTDITDPVNKTTTLSYSGKHLKSVTDPTGRSTSFTHDNTGNLIQVTLPDNTTESFGYDDRHLMIMETDRRSQLVQRVFDDQGRINRASLPEGVTRELEYSLSSGLPSAGTGTTSNPTTLKLAADVNSGITDGEGRETTYQLGALARPVQITDPNDLVTTTQRDDDGNPTRITLPSRGDIRYQYDAEGNVIEYNNSSVNVIDNQYSYDTYSGAVTSVTDWGGNVATYKYDTNGNLTQAVTPLGRDVSLTYDERGLPQTIVDPLGTESSFIYSADGNPTQIAIGADADARITKMAYTPEGYVQNVTDPLGRTFGFAYDPLGRLSSETLPGSQTVSYTYDSEGNLTSVTPPGRPAHLFEYDGLGQVTAYVPPAVNGSGDNRTTYSYNKAQQLTSVVRPDGKQIAYDYDSGGRLITQTQPRGIISFEYGSTSGTLNRISSPDDVVLRYRYDGDRVDSIRWEGAIEGYIGIDLRPDGVLGSYNISAGQSGNRSIYYQHDDDDAFTKAGQIKLTYGESSGLLATTSLDDISDDREYNAFGEMSSYEATYDEANSLYQTSYLYDDLGRITTITETAQGVTKTLGYGYDEAGRLQSVAENGSETASYTYDVNGNRLTGPNGATGTYDVQDRVLTYGNASYTYTANGELLTKTAGNQTTTYDYDVMGNLMGVDLPDGTTITYLVDGQNRRIGKRINGGLQYGLLYKDQLNPVAKLDAEGEIDHIYIYGSHPHVPDYIAASAEDGPAIRYRLITDHLGSVRLVVNAQTGEVVQEIAYDAWGNVIKDTNPGFQPFGFAGGLYDVDTGLVRFGARDYDTEAGRWTAKDPLRFKGGTLNLYLYTTDPINFIDITGQQAVSASVLGGFGVDVSTPEPSDAFLPKWIAWAVVLGGAAVYDLCDNGNYSTYFHYGYAEQASNFVGGLNPNSYATKGPIMSGDTAQDKLALPHRLPPDSYYVVRVTDSTPVIGPSVVQSTVNPPRSGGGIEYIFPEGTPPGSISGPFPLPCQQCSN